MALYTTLASLSQTAGSNAADGAVDAPSTIDQQTNLLASFIAQLRDGTGFTVGVNRVANCRVAKSGANLVLSRYDGDGITINGVVYSIPSGGVSLAIGAAVAATTYNIYVFMSGSTMTLEFSATAHAVDTATGMRIKSGDATRTLVALARTTAGTAAWADEINQRFVISWFNRKPIQCQAGLGSATTSTSTTAAELSTTLRCEFLTWGEAVSFAFDGYASNNTASATCRSHLALDGTLVEGYSVMQDSGSANLIGPVSVTSAHVPAEGYHYMTAFVSVSAGTGSWIGSASVGTRCSVKGVIYG